MGDSPYSDCLEQVSFITLYSTEQIQFKIVAASVSFADAACQVYGRRVFYVRI